MGTLRSERILACVLGFMMSMTVVSTGVAGSWSEGAPIPTLRDLAAAGVIDGKLYVAGGWDPRTSTGLDVVELYDPRTDQWTTGVPLDRPVHSAAAGVAGDQLFLIGGLSGSVFLQTMRRFDPQTNTWSEEPQPFGSLRSSQVLAVGDESSLYVVGRYTSSSIVGVWRFDIGSCAWTQLSDVPMEAVGPAVALHDGKIYVVGGIVGFGSEPHATDSLQVFDLESETWSVGTPARIIRHSGLAGVIGDEVLVVGGSVGMNFEVLSDLESYDPNKDEWGAGPAMRTGRYLGVSGVIDGRLVVASGRDENGLLNSTVEIFDPADKPDAICICHYPPGNPDNHQTICVGAKAADRHIKQHSDTLGECSF